MKMLKIAPLTLSLLIPCLLFGACQKPPAYKKYVFSGPEHGCGDIVVFRGTADRTAAINVRADKKALDLTTEPKTFEIENNRAIKVYIEDFGNSDYSTRPGYCVDKVMPGPDPARIAALSGKVTISLSKIADNNYEATVVLENAAFQPYEIGNKFLIERVEFTNVQVGWYPG